MNYRPRNQDTKVRGTCCGGGWLATVLHVAINDRGWWRGFQFGAWSRAKRKGKEQMKKGVQPTRASSDSVGWWLVAAEVVVKGRRRRRLKRIWVKERGKRKEKRENGERK